MMNAPDGNIGTRETGQTSVVRFLFLYNSCADFFGDGSGVTLPGIEALDK